MVVYHNGFDGFGAFGVGSKYAVPCGVGVDETSYDGLGEGLIKLFNVMGCSFEGHK